MDPDPEDTLDYIRYSESWTHIKNTESYPYSIIFNQNSNNPSDWKCRLFGIDNFFFIPEKGKEPNIFWRIMQYLLLGNKWSKTND